MFVKTRNGSFDELPPSAKEAYEIGARVGKRYGYNEGKFLDALRSGELDLPIHLFFNGIEGTFFDAGVAGKPMPSEFVFAERIGEISKAGVSYNFRDQHPEKGVSVLGLLDPERGLVRQNDGMFELFNDGKHHYVSGWLLDETGSDGEPLLIGARRFNEKNQVKSATANNGAFSRNNDDILFSVKQEESTGHAQPLSAKVLTPSGFRRMGDIHAGDEVITPDGSATKVTDVFPQGVQPVWRIVLSDGSETRTTLDHLWRMRPEGEEDFRVMTLSEIMPGIAAGRRYELPEVAV
jgi:hypothetical protein